MAPIEFPHPVRYTPMVMVASHLALVSYLSYAVGASLYTSYKSLGPSQQTRPRQAMRTKLAPAFLSLALAALGVAYFTSIRTATLSYAVWSYELGIPPDSDYVYLAQWLTDTPIYLDILEIATEKARRFWWSQQVDLAMLSWSMLLAIEGRRRKIPLLPAFMTLAHLVNLSYAQNLFYLALLFTPAPLASGQEDLELPVAPVSRFRWTQHLNNLLPRKPRDWTPHPFIFYAPLVISFCSLYVLPYAAKTPSFTTTVLIVRGLTFLPLVLPEIAPARWGKVVEHRHDTYASLNRVFRFISTMSLVLHLKASALGLADNVPDSSFHRHSSMLPWDVEQRTNWERTTTATGKVLGSVADHPVVAAVGCDALICALAMGVWVAVRAPNVQDILGSMVPFSHKHANVTDPNGKASNGSMKSKTVPPEETKPHAPYNTRSSLRGVRSRAGSVASSSAASEEASSTGRKRGRPKKALPVEEEPYEPTPSEAKEVVEGDILPATEPDWESAALSWGLAILGGLGSASAGVFGAECVSR